jgi:flagellar hook-length control protein FliK
VCLLIQPIVMVHTAKSNTGKPLEKDGYTSSEFDEIFLASVGAEKGKEVNVETSGLLTYVLPDASLIGSRNVTNSSAELTEVIENQPVSKITTTSSTEKEQTIQQDQLPYIIEGELSQLLQINPKMNNLTVVGEIPYHLDPVKTEDLYSSTVINKSMNVQIPVELGQDFKQVEQNKGFQVSNSTSPESDSLLLEDAVNIKSNGSNGASVLEVKLSRDDASNRQISAMPKDPSSLFLELRNGSKESIDDSKGNRITINDVLPLQESKSFSAKLSHESSLSLNFSSDQISNRIGSRLPKFQVSPLPIKEFGRPEMKMDINRSTSSSTEVQPLIQENAIEFESSVVLETTQNDDSNAKIRDGAQTQSQTDILLQQSDLKLNNAKNKFEFSIPIDRPKGIVLNGEITEETNKSSHIMETRNDFGRNEMAESILIAEKSTGENHPIMNPTLSQSDLTSLVLPDTFEKQALPSTLNVVQFEKEIDMFVKSAFQVQDLSDGIEATFSLSPEHMGKVDVKVSIIDGNVTAELLTSTTAGKDLLEAHVQTLRIALETQGFQVDKINVSQQNASTFLGSFSQKGESNGRHPQQDAKKRNVQMITNQEKEYKDYGLDSGTQINTTA